MTDWPYIYWPWLIAAAFIGAWLGALVMALCLAEKTANGRSGVYRLGQPDWPGKHGPPPSGGSVLPEGTDE